MIAIKTWVYACLLILATIGLSNIINKIITQIKKIKQIAKARKAMKQLKNEFKGDNNNVKL